MTNGRIRAMLGAMSPIPTGHGLAAPLPFAVRSLLRMAAVEHVRGDRRTVYPACLHVGTPGGFRASCATDDIPDDFGARVDLIHVLSRLTEREPVGTPDGTPWVWLTRCGPAVPGDIELSLLGPALHAFGEVGAPLTYFVVTRRGWMDPRSGLHRSWTRLRAA